MKHLPSLLAALALVLSAHVARADSQTREVQSALKDQGFFYGEVDGQSGPELSAAVRRFQIRNGLEVSGSLNPETLDVLGVARASAPARPTATPAPQPRVAATPRPPVHLRRDPGQAPEEFAPRDAVRPPADPSIIRPPAPLDDGGSTSMEPSAAYTRLFHDTPYEAAPRVVQQQTLLRAQGLLKSRGFYRGEIDGVPGPATEEAVLGFQRSSRLPMTGDFDLETLNALRLLPGRGSNPPLRPFNSPATRDAGAQPNGRFEMWIER